MNFALTYLIERAGYRMIDFFHHWYVDGSRRMLHSFMSLFERLDAVFALRITITHFFEPLYKDYTVVGRIVGVVFRSLRIVLALAVYAATAAILAAIYLAWIATPAFIVLYIMRSLVTRTVP